MKTFQFLVAGTKFRMAEYRTANPIRGDRLTLVLEPTNKHDPLAIAVYKGDIQIGYVPRSHNAQLHEALKSQPDDVGCCVEAAGVNGGWVVVNIKEQNEHKTGEATTTTGGVDGQAP